MENILLLVHLLTALAIIGLILMQQGKGAEMGASFGAGASQTLFGSGGSGNFFSRLTAIAATVFFVTSFSLAVVAKHQSNVGDDDLALPELEQLEDASVTTNSDDSDVPALEVEGANVDTAATDEVPVLDAEETTSSDAEDEVPAAPTE